MVASAGGVLTYSYGQGMDEYPRAPGTLHWDRLYGSSAEDESPPDCGTRQAQHGVLSQTANSLQRFAVLNGTGANNGRLQRELTVQALQAHSNQETALQSMAAHLANQQASTSQEEEYVHRQGASADVRASQRSSNAGSGSPSTKEASAISSQHVEHKACGRCGIVKPRSAYHQNRSKPSGLGSWCKDCTVAWYQSKPRNEPRTGNKRCTGCQLVKPASEFHRQSRLPTGLRIYCKDCEHQRYKKKAKVSQPTVAEKACTKCSVVKPAECFHRQRNVSTGLHSWCKDCVAADYARNPRHRKSPGDATDGKRCVACNRTKPVAAFARTRPGGLCGDTCQACRTAGSSDTSAAGTRPTGGAAKGVTSPAARARRQPPDNALHSWRQAAMPQGGQSALAAAAAAGLPSGADLLSSLPALPTAARPTLPAAALAPAVPRATKAGDILSSLPFASHVATTALSAFDPLGNWGPQVVGMPDTLALAAPDTACLLPTSAAFAAAAAAAAAVASGNGSVPSSVERGTSRRTAAAPVLQLSYGPQGPYLAPVTKPDAALKECSNCRQLREPRRFLVDTGALDGSGLSGWCVDCLRDMCERRLAVEPPSPAAPLPASPAYDSLQF